MQSRLETRSQPPVVGGYVPRFGYVLDQSVPFKPNTQFEP